MDETKANIQPVNDEEADLGEVVRQVLRVATKQRLWILLAGLGTLLAAVAGLSFVPDVYRCATTILVVEQQIPQSMVAPLSTVTGTQKLQALTQEVLSRSSLLKIIDETHLFAGKNLPPDAAVGLMRKSIDVVPDGVTRDGSLINTFVISFSASTPGLAQEVTRRLASLFIERHSETQTTRANSTSGFLKETLTEKRKRATELEQQIRDFKIRHAGELAEGRLGNETQAAGIRVQLQNTLAALSRAKQQRVIWEATISAKLNSKLTRLKTERAALLDRFTPKHPQVMAKEEEIALLEHMLANLRAEALSQEQLDRLATIDPTAGQLLGQSESNRQEIDSLSKEQKRLEAVEAELQRRINLTPAFEQQMAGMVREAELANQEVAKLAGMDQQSTLSADMERRQQGEQFRQLEPPALPLKPSSPARFKITAGAAVGGVVLGIIMAFLADMRKACFYTELQIRRKYSPPLILSVPELLTSGELRKRRWRGGMELTAGVFVMATMAAIEFYVYRHS